MTGSPQVKKKGAEKPKEYAELQAKYAKMQEMDMARLVEPSSLSLVVGTCQKHLLGPCRAMIIEIALLPTGDTRLVHLLTVLCGSIAALYSTFVLKAVLHCHIDVHTYVVGIPCPGHPIAPFRCML